MYCPGLCTDLVKLHLKAAKRVLRYVKGTHDFGVKFEKGRNLELVGYSDNDWGGSFDDIAIKRLSHNNFNYFSQFESMAHSCQKNLNKIVRTTLIKAKINKDVFFSRDYHRELINY